MKNFVLIYFLIFLGSSHAQYATTSFLKDKEDYYHKQDWLGKAEILEGVLNEGLDENDFLDFQYKVDHILLFAKKRDDKFLINYCRFLTSFILYSQENYKQAMKLSKPALKYFILNDNLRLEAYAYRDVGICEKGIGEYSKALYYFNKSNQAFLKLKNKVEIHHNKVHIATILIKSQQYKKAIKIFDQAIPIMVKNKKYRTVFDYYNILSDMYSNMNDTNMVRFCNKKSYEYAIKSNDLTTISLAQNNLAITQFYKGNILESIALFKEALKTRIKTDKKRLVCESYYNIASVYQEIADFQQAEFYFTKSLELAKKNELLTDIGDAYLALAQINKEFKYYKKANEYNEKYIEIQEKIQIRNLKEINSNTYDSVLEDSQLFLDSNSKPNWLNSNFSFFILCLGNIVLIIILFLNFRKHKSISSI